MKDFWLKTTQQVAALSQREKILLMLTGLIIIPGLFDFFLLQPLRDNNQKWRQQTQKINARLVSFSEQQNDLLAEIESDPAMELERKIEGVTNALGVAKTALVQYTDTLIAPERMAVMLENMLHERGNLKLVSLENLPVAPLFGDQKVAEKKTIDKEEAENVFGLYRHNIRLVFKGNYMATMDYLQNLEELPWKFYWQNFYYEVQQHPQALITLNVYTLSTSKYWIGDKDDE